MAQERTQQISLSQVAGYEGQGRPGASFTSPVLDEGVDIFPLGVGEQEVGDPGGHHPELLDCLRETLHLAGMAHSARHGEGSFLVPADKRIVELLMQPAVALYGALPHLICYVPVIALPEYRGKETCRTGEPP
jgi:hypothetical protein